MVPLPPKAQILEGDGETVERLNLMTTQEEEDLVEAANVVVQVHTRLFGFPNAFFVTAQHGWNQAWYVDVFEEPGKVVIHSLN